MHVHLNLKISFFNLLNNVPSATTSVIQLLVQMVENAIDFQYPEKSVRTSSEDDTFELDS